PISRPPLPLRPYHFALRPCLFPLAPLLLPGGPRLPRSVHVPVEPLAELLCVGVEAGAGRGRGEKTAGWRRLPRGARGGGGSGGGVAWGGRPRPASSRRCSSLPPHQSRRHG